MTPSWRTRLPAVQRLLRMGLVFIVPLVLILGVLGGLAMQVSGPLLQGWTNRELDERADLVSKALHGAIMLSLEGGNPVELTQQIESLTEDERLYAIAVCTSPNAVLASSRQYPQALGCADTKEAAGKVGQPMARWLSQMHVRRIDLPVAPAAGGGLVSDAVPDDGHVTLVVMQNPVEAGRRGELAQRYLTMLFVGLGVVLTLLFLTVANFGWRHWTNSVRRILSDGARSAVLGHASPEVQPLLPDLKRLLRSVHEDRRILKDTTIEWRPETLKLLLREHLSGDEVIVVSNREPYIHQRNEDGSIRVQRPASGLVTAVEPVMRACSGTWVAHGSGSADADVVDARSRVRVPPIPAGGEPLHDAYTLRRVWLSEAEEQGYYYGFANEGLWPLCHIAHVRPVFREEDWQQYRAVNARFADAVADEARTDNPVVLVQDYHFALLPRMLRERLPKATIITFWHIPWPNPESFGICPWAREILEGMLGSTILGFHTPYHCQNFMATVDRFLEARITQEDQSVSFMGQRTQVRDYPISIPWKPPADDALSVAQSERASVRLALGLAPEHRLAIGVDRLDYTKGIVERMLAVERLLERHPMWLGRFSLIQIAAPTRSSLEAYSQLDQRVREEARRINALAAERAPGTPPPIILLIEQHDSESVRRHYRACEIAMVTSLHDGMNLVAKEYIATRDTEDGVLILSRFAGAASELHEALVVNPYHIDETAEALAKALSMHPAEQRERMRAMRKRLADFNIYRWAGRMLLDAADERQRARVQDRIVQVSGVVAPEGLFRSPWRGRRAANGGINPPANDRNKRAHEV
ncbi:trehalose-6-phosphate synthase [Aquabacterium sp.]|uniref:trehalose-6-phosphate synthase n=1 Tax=Aquabacterium sp. TaxID=1872578 RepID=UPI0035C78239